MVARSEDRHLIIAVLAVGVSLGGLILATDDGAEIRAELRALVAKINDIRDYIAIKQVSSSTSR